MSHSEEILVLFKIMKAKDIAKKFNITTQRVYQITRRAEKRGTHNFREIVLGRKREAMRIADGYNHSVEPYRKHL